jgi:hypothetical protein
MDICYIGSAPFITLAQRPNYEIFAVLIANINKALSTKTYTNLKTKVPLDYYNLIYVFSRAEANKLLIQRPYNH